MIILTLSSYETYESKYSFRFFAQKTSLVSLIVEKSKLGVPTMHWAICKSKDMRIIMAFIWSTVLSILMPILKGYCRVLYFHTNEFKSKIAFWIWTHAKYSGQLSSYESILLSLAVTLEALLSNLKAKQVILKDLWHCSSQITD